MSDRRYPRFPIPGVGGIVIGDRGVLLVKRFNEPGKGLWSAPGGGVEVGESQIEALQREVYEETGVKCTVLKFLTTYDLILPDENGEIEFHFLLNHYLAKPDTEDIRPEVPEAEVAWFKLDSLPLESMHPSMVKLIEAGRTEIETSK